MSDPTSPVASDDPTADGYEWDPTFLNCRREAGVSLLVWFLALCWTVPYSWFNGYQGEDFDPATLSTVFGIPSWVFYGVMAPWAACLGVTVWYCVSFMKDDHLGDSPEEGE